MSGLRRRLERLEGGNRPCSGCGHGSGEYEYVVEWMGLGEPPTPDPPPCGTCGRPSEIVVEWDPPAEPLDWRDLVPDYPPQDWPKGGR